VLIDYQQQTKRKTKQIADFLANGLIEWLPKKYGFKLPQVSIEI
jgi:hypothetical protein